MSAETLRRAAALMRERAEQALASPWRAECGASGGWWVEHPYDADVALEVHDGDTAEHIASWHPAVALAVADLLEKAARDMQVSIDDARAYGERLRDLTADFGPALAAACTYLGETNRLAAIIENLET